MRVRFWGTRGSIATPGASTLRFGGNTSCIEVVTNAGQRFIIDCGTGARPLGLHMMAHAPQPIRGTILLGHTHWDHIQGFPFFAPVFVAGNEFAICAPSGIDRSLAEVLAGQMEFTYFPVELKELAAKITCRDLSEGRYEFGGVRVLTQFMNHPALCLAYRIEADGVVVVYMCDHEPFGPAVWREGAGRRLPDIVHDGDRRHAEFMRHADLLIHDGQYLPEEYEAKRNWGHSTYEYAVELAAATDVRQLALTHHDPGHDDETVAEIERRARVLAAKRNFSLKVFCAYEGCEMTVAPPDSDRLRTVTMADSALPVAPGRLRVMVVDDDPQMRLLLVTALKRDGYVTQEATDGQEALESIEELPPDLLLLDTNMPRLDGLGVLKILRGRLETARLPVILVTARGDATSTEAGFAAGATDYLVKPFTVPQLAARVRACLVRSGAGAETQAACASGGPGTGPGGNHA